jgi:hypothetical protein
MTTTEHRKKTTQTAVVCAILMLQTGCLQQTDPRDVKTFEDCKNAGYPILEYYPRQCTTPDNRTITSDKDVLDATQVIICNDDMDCRLVNRKYGLGCCHSGRCNPIDYSEYEWTAVNGEWYQRQAKQTCPKDTECGPAPACEQKTVNNNYKAACINGKCQKIQRT